MEDNVASISIVVTEAKYVDVLSEREFVGNMKVSAGEIRSTWK
jgi:hypothetical protein